MKRTALNSGNAFGNQLLAAVDQARVFRPILFCTAWNSLIVILIWLTQIRRVGIRNRALLAHPQQGCAGVEAAGESDANTLSNRKMLENRRHKINPC